jgi:hypothetical protein
MQLFHETNSDFLPIQSMLKRRTQPSPSTQINPFTQKQKKTITRFRCRLHFRTENVEREKKQKKRKKNAKKGSTTVREASSLASPANKKASSSSVTENCLGVRTQRKTGRGTDRQTEEMSGFEAEVTDIPLRGRGEGRVREKLCVHGAARQAHGRPGPERRRLRAAAGAVFFWPQFRPGKGRRAASTLPPGPRFPASVRGPARPQGVCHALRNNAKQMEYTSESATWRNVSPKNDVFDVTNFCMINGRHNVRPGAKFSPHFFPRKICFPQNFFKDAFSFGMPQKVIFPRKKV